MRTATSSRSARLATISTIGAMIFVASVLAATPAAASDTQDAYYEHHWMCVELLFSDAEAHADNCLPSRIVPSLGSPSKKSSGEYRKPPYPRPCYPTYSESVGFTVSFVDECEVQ